MKKFFEKITHIIIPHEKNGNVPHILQEEFIFILVVFIGVLFYFNQNNFNIIKQLNLTATVYPAVLADLTNQDRTISNLPQLAWSDTLEKAAKLKARDMLENSYFAHTSPNGLTPWHWLKEVNYNFIYAGENLAVDFTDSVNVEQAWLNSPKHRENILNSHFTEIGIATVDGVFEGKNTTFVVEFFGSPTKEKVKEKIVVKQKEAEINKIEKIITPSVAGESTENIKAPASEANLKIVEETEKFIVVKNENVDGETLVNISGLENRSMSTWYERFILNPTRTVKIVYITILGLILISVLLMLSKEYQKHHRKHLIMGVILMVIIVVLLYIIFTNTNSNIF